jgi:4-carboxymuconolactone decarboxylase
VDDGQARRQRGEEKWKRVTMSPVREPSGPFSEAVLDFVASEVWSRPGLADRDRRWISLTCTGFSGHRVPIRAHLRSALLSGDMSREELEEFVLHFAVYAGWPLASFVHQTLNEVIQEIEAESKDRN